VQLSATSRQVGPLGAILLPGPVLLTGMLALQAVLPSDATACFYRKPR